MEIKKKSDPQRRLKKRSVLKTHKSLDECRRVQASVDESLDESKRMQTSVDEVNKSKKPFF